MKTRYKVLSTLCLATLVGAGTYDASMGDVPDLTPQLRIESPGLFIRAGQPIPVRVAYQDFDAQPSLRCNPAGACAGSLPATVTQGPNGLVAQGHIHVYFQKVSSQFPATQAISFCIPATVVATPELDGTISGNCPALTSRGVYRVSAEFQSNSHISSLKADNSPQHVPTSDTHLLVVGN